MDANRYVQLTETGVNRLQAARRRYRSSVDDIVGDVNTPSVNTVKRALKQAPVFVSTLERIWDYFQRCATNNGERLPYLAEGKDYTFVEPAPKTESKVKGQESLTEPVERRHPWISHQMPRPNRLFTGRRDVLERLHTALKTGPAALVADPQALTGFGGIGKTQTAIAYVYEHWRDYSHVFWVSAEAAETLNDGLAGLAAELKLLDAAPSTKKQALERMHEWFRNEADWLLVLDNADDIEALAPYFPRYHAGRLLITTRARNTVKWAAPIRLVKLGQTDGALLLLRRAGVLSVDESLDGALENVALAAMEICDDLDGLPLALDQAGAYLAETTISVTEYRALYRACGLRLLDSITDPEHASVTVTFTLALEQMLKHSLYGEAAVEMVQLCAFLVPDSMPEAIFTSYRFERESLASPVEEPVPYDAIWATACSYSLVTRNPDNRTFTIHRLVQKVMQDAMSPGERRRWCERAVQAVSDATPDFEFEDWSLCDLLTPQWRLCADYIRNDGIETVHAAHLLYQSGRYLRARALYEEAESHLQSAVAIAEKVHGSHDANMADYYDELACLYRVLDRRNDSEALHLRAVEIVENTEGSEHASVASKLHNMALLYYAYADYEKAEETFLRALAIYEKQHSPDRLLIAATQTQIAGVYRNAGHFEKAEPYCRQALIIYESALEPGHIDIATACSNLALLYVAMGRYGEAEDLYLRALQINEQARGQEHPETGATVWGLARTRWKQRRSEEADKLFQRAIRIYTKQFGPQHVMVSRILSSYSEFQQDSIPIIS